MEQNDGGAIVVKYTWNGDGTLDGKIDADDYFLIDQGYRLQADTAFRGYDHGDFDYSGTVTADDYYLIDRGFMHQTEVPTSSLMDNLAAGLSQTVVAYGTSLTAYGAWVGQLQAWIDAQYPGKLTMINSGISGSYSVTGLQYLSSHVLAYHPDTVFIEFAVNDAYTPYATTVTQSKANLNQMIDLILADNPHTEIILQTMNSAWDVPGGNQSAALRPDLGDYYQGYREVAAARGLLLIDNYPAWVNLQHTDTGTFQAYVPDGIHPSAEALAVMTTPRIEAALVSKPFGAEYALAKNTLIVIDAAEEAAAALSPSEAMMLATPGLPPAPRQLSELFSGQLVRDPLA